MKIYVASLTEFNADDYLKNNESREFGDWKFEVIFTPGMPPDMFAFSSARKVFCWPRSYSALYSADPQPRYIRTIISAHCNLSGFFKRHREIACRHIYPDMAMRLSI